MLSYFALQFRIQVTKYRKQHNLAKKYLFYIQIKDFTFLTADLHVQLFSISVALMTHQGETLMRQKGFVIRFNSL